MACKEGKKHPHQHPRTRNTVEGLFKVQGSNEEKAISFQIENTTLVPYLLKEGGIHCKTLNGLARKILLTCHRNVVMVCSEYLRWWGDLVVDLSASWQAHRVPQYFSLGLSDRRVSGEDALKKKCPKGLKYALPSKHHSSSPGQASKMERRPDLDHTVLARSELVPILVAPMECNNWEAILTVMENIQWLPGGLHCHLYLECHQRINCQESHWLLVKRTKQKYQHIFEQWCSFWYKRGYQSLRFVQATW